MILALFSLTACVGHLQQDKPLFQLQRDQYGTPQISADDVFGLFYGYGYAVAQDRLFQMEMLKRTVYGRVSAILGADFVSLDRKIQNGFDPADIKRQMTQLSHEEKQILAGYAAGINAWLAEIERTPEKLLPAEFLHFDFQPSTWSAEDVAMVFVGSMAHRYADFNEELANLSFLQNLIAQHGLQDAWRLFDATMPIYDDDDPVTVPDSESSRQRGPEHHQSPPYIKELILPESLPRRSVLDKQGRYYSDHKNYENYMRDEFARSGTPGVAGFSAASNLWALNGDKLRGADSVLFNGPQFGWSLPSYVYGVGLQGAGFTVNGNTLLAYPAHLFGHNADIGWGSTAGFGDLVDIYFHRLNPDNPDQYWYQGKYVDFEKRQLRIAVKGDSDVVEWSYRSRYGPVISRDLEKGVAFSKHRSWEGHEVENLMAWVQLGKAKNFAEFRAQIKRINLNINFYYMDSSGNIGYIHAGKYPRRHPQHDHRLPVPGDGRYDWQGYVDFADNPQVYNPQRGYLYNWNNRPERNWPSSDLWWVNWRRGHRATMLDKALAEQASFTPKQVWQLNRLAAHHDVNADSLLPALRKVAAKASPENRDAIALLADWDRLWLDSDADGYFDHAANLIMEHWLSSFLQRVFADDVGADFMFRFAATGYPMHKQVASISMQPGTKILVNQLQGPQQNSYDFFNGQTADELVLETFQQTIASLIDAQGTNMADWRIATKPLTFVPYNFRGVPQALPDAAPELPVIMNRGSENNQFTAVNGKISAVDVIPPAQSGFIAPGQNSSDYPLDQMQLYLNYDSKPTPANNR